MIAARGVLAIGGGLALLAIAASSLASRESLHARAAQESAEIDRAALAARTRAADLATRARTEDGAESHVRAWAAAVDADPTWADARAALAESHEAWARELDAQSADASRREHEAAVRAADDAVAHGASARAYYVKGIALESLGDRAGARGAFFEAARTAFMEEAFIRHQALAEVAYDDGRYRDAIDESSRALDANPGAVDAAALHERAAMALREAP